MVDRYNNSRGMFRGNLGCNRCSDNNCGSPDCRALQMKLKMIDFSLIDTILYLDAYPNCKKALDHYHKLKAEREMVADAINNSCNMPITSFNNTSECSWNWVDNPWPWDADAN